MLRNRMKFMARIQQAEPAKYNDRQLYEVNFKETEKKV